MFVQEIVFNVKLELVEVLLMIIGLDTGEQQFCRLNHEVSDVVRYKFMDGLQNKHKNFEIYSLSNWQPMSNCHFDNIQHSFIEHYIFNEILFTWKIF